MLKFLELVAPAGELWKMGEGVVVPDATGPLSIIAQEAFVRLISNTLV
jgi:hypothetical protein